MTRSTIRMFLISTMMVLALALGACGGDGNADVIENDPALEAPANNLGG